MVTFRKKDKSNEPDLPNELVRLKRRVRELEAVNQLAELTGSTMDVERILRVIVDEAIRLTEASQGSISIVDGEAPSGMTTLVRGKESGHRGDTLRVDGSLTGWVLQNKKPLVVKDLSRDERFPGFRGKDYEVKTVLSVPLFSKGRVIGAVNLCNRRDGRAFTEDDVSLVSTLSSQSVRVIDSARLYERVARENLLLKREVGGKYHFESIVGRSEAMRRVFALLERVISSEASVVIQGESGTGKELVAKAIHYNGPRKEGPFVPVECGAIPDGLLEREFYGHERGVFTGADRDKIGLFQEANGGTIFLDEISNMAPALQVKLLRALEEREVRPLGATKAQKIDVRIISASSGDLEDLVAQGLFRADLFYRLNVVTVTLPPLRDRKDDISLLANHFLSAFGDTAGKRVWRFSPEAMRLLELYSWPGNVRELQHVVERGITLATPEEEEIGPIHLPEKVVHSPTHLPALTEGKALKEILDGVKREVILDALEKYDWNKTQAAKRLRVSRQGLIKMIQELRLAPRDTSTQLSIVGHRP